MMCEKNEDNQVYMFTSFTGIKQLNKHMRKYERLARSNELFTYILQYYFCMHDLDD